MITPREIRDKALRLYPSFLLAVLNDESFFPQVIRCRKINPGDDFSQISAQIKQISREEKSQKGYGYRVLFKSVNTRRHGPQTLPDKILFENKSDFLKYIGKDGEFRLLQEMISRTGKMMPMLLPWLKQHPRQLIRYLSEWPEILAVCRYFLENPRPALYIRELPIDNLDTKFIENHRGILTTLLDLLMPADAINNEEKDFARRYYLKYAQPLIRLRVLDPLLRPRNDYPGESIAIPVEDFEMLQPPGNVVFITENLINFLTLPAFPDAIGILGNGFRVQLLRNVHWLQSRDIYYWGDIDVQGMQILSQLRGYHPQVQSLMMDFATLEGFRQFAVAGKPTKAVNLPHLTAQETELFDYLKRHNLRLEQERIPQGFVNQQILKTRIG